MGLTCQSVWPEIWSIILLGFEGFRKLTLFGKFDFKDKKKINHTIVTIKQKKKINENFSLNNL